MLISMADEQKHFTNAHPLQNLTNGRQISDKQFKTTKPATVPLICTPQNMRSANDLILAPDASIINTVPVIYSVPLKDNTVPVIHSVPLKDSMVPVIHSVPLKDNTVPVIHSVPLKDNVVPL